MSRRHHCSLPVGAELIDNHRTRFRLWAPDLQQLELIIDGLSPIRLQRRDDGLFEGEVYCGSGTRYRYRLPERDGLLIPDPASRCQDGSVHAPSIVCDPHAFLWHHDGWRGRPWTDMVIYELHVGAVGGFEKAIRILPDLVELGITAIELMPIADFAGSRNWGYDGVLPFAPASAYGSPTQLKQLIDTAHGLGMCVYLDVVYNHFGPDGNYLHAYASPFFDAARQSPWGAAIDFTQPRVREFFSANALYWLQEYRFDGLRLDAVHAISDAGWLDEMAAQVRAAIEPGRQVHLVLENEHNEATHLDRDFDAQWNDDAHNVLHHLLTGEQDSYYLDYAEAPAAKLAHCLAEGFIYQGEVSPRLRRPRGSASAHLPPHAFVLFLQNHDQIGNRAFGERLTTLVDEDKLRAAITLQLLAPQIPLLFMGEEWGSRSPFLFFTDFSDELAAAVREGRRQEFAALPAFADPHLRATIPDPNAITTFTASIPDTAEKDLSTHQRYLAFYRDLLALRRNHIAPALQGCRSLGALVVGDAAVVGFWRLDNGNGLTIAANFGDKWIDLDGDAQSEVGMLICDSRSGPISDSSAQPLQQLPPRCTRVFLREPAPVSRAVDSESQR